MYKDIILLNFSLNCCACETIWFF